VTSRFSRRQLLVDGTAAAAAAAVLAACSGGGKHSAATTTTTTSKTPSSIKPTDAPFDTVVVLTMENRSYDHLLGWLPGSDGKQKGLSYTDPTGASHDTWALAPDWQGWKYSDPKHDFQSVNLQYNAGKCDGFLRTQPTGDTYPIGYYTEDDLPVLATLAQQYTTFDNYFCSLLGPTWPNRFYMHSAATDIDYTGIYPYMDHPTQLPPPGVERPSKLTLAIWDRLKAKGLTGGYYYFSEPMTGLYASRKYDSISHHYDKFKADAANGKLPNVTFLDPEYGTLPELNGTSNDMHPHGSVKVGDAFIGEVYDLLRASPQWERVVFVVTFDEHGGFYDHVPPPRVRDDNINPNFGAHPDYGRVGFRVPAILISPYAPRRIETRGPFEHCSILRMIEWRWNLAPMHARDRYAKNLAAALDFSQKREAVDLPKVEVPPTVPRPA
jgi:phospholipase C